ncbi:MAG: VacJ family lipoprotein [Alphaproteobacteria bacterium]
MPGVHRFAAAGRYPVLTLFALALAACATPPSIDEPEALAAYEEARDPLEPTNRQIFEFNRGLDRVILKPVAESYREVVPAFARRRVRNFLNNLKSPVVFVNDVLQAKPDRATVTLGRFLINSTFGLAGLFDIPALSGDVGHDEDFGQTLAVWGLGDGPYLMLPLLGPSNPRDGIGILVDSILDPFNYILPTAGSIARTGATAVDRREAILDSLDEVERTSIDFYAAIRSLYRQHRGDEIRDQELPPLPPILDITQEEVPPIPDITQEEVGPKGDEEISLRVPESFEEVVARLWEPY